MPWPGEYSLTVSCIRVSSKGVHDESVEGREVNDVEDDDAIDVDKDDGEVAIISLIRSIYSWHAVGIAGVGLL